MIYHNVYPYLGIHETDLKRRILYWRDTSVDSCFYALAIREALRRPQLDEDCRTTLMKFLADNFVAVKAEKDWQAQLYAFRQCAVAEPTVYATSMAINVVKELYGIPWDERLGYEAAAEKFGAIQVDTQELLKFVRKCQDQESGGGFYDYPAGAFDQVASIQTTHSACHVLWNLEHLDEFAQGIREFTFSCLRQEEDKLGFAERPRQDDPALSCSTYYALQILQKLPKSEEEEQSWMETEAIRRKLIAFLETCWHKEGGFRASPSSGRTLIHTALAVAILVHILEEPEPLMRDDRFEKLIAYIDSCIDRHGGLQLWSRAFALGGKWYAPNLYATRHGVCALQLLERYRTGTEKQVLDKAQINDLLDAAALGSENSCIWRGYPVDTRRLGRVIGRLSRRLSDSILMPSNPLRYPQLKMTPMPYYFVGAVSMFALLVILLGYLFFVTTPQIWLLFIGPLAMAISAWIWWIPWIWRR